MNEEVSNSNPKKTWSKSIETDSVRKYISVNKVENGYIITIDKDVKKENGNWEYNSKKYISKDNPIDKSFKEGENKKEDIDVIDSIDLNDLDGINF